MVNVKVRCGSCQRTAALVEWLSHGSNKAVCPQCGATHEGISLDRIHNREHEKRLREAHETVTP